MNLHLLNSVTRGALPRGAGLHPNSRAQNANGSAVGLIDFGGMAIIAYLPTARSGPRLDHHHLDVERA
jgi:hypothetical protein